MLRRIFYNTYLAAEAEAEDHRLSGNPGHSGRKVFLICITVALSLTMIKYLGEPKFFASFLENLGLESLASAFTDSMSIHPNAELLRLTHWVGIILLFYFAVPFALIRLVFRERLTDYGMSFKGAFRDYYLYLIMLVVMVPLVVFFSTTSSFQAKYPFYELGPGEPLFPNFWTWELLYFLQFLALEFFFRGFMVHGMKQRFGFYSVLVMTIPYCMIHFGKPLPETIAAIVAGIVLGTLSLKSRSIWLGVAIHYSVGLTMDLCALWQKGLL